MVMVGLMLVSEEPSERYITGWRDKFDLRGLRYRQISASGHNPLFQIRRRRVLRRRFGTRGEYASIPTRLALPLPDSASRDDRPETRARLITVGEAYLGGF
jgi:hypothetical protein